MDLGLKRKRALVLAASRGLGYACARGLAQEGCDLVICSRVTRTVKQRVANWVELYPDCKPYSTFCIGGERRAKRDVQLSDLLDLCASPQ